MVSMATAPPPSRSRPPPDPPPFSSPDVRRLERCPPLLLHLCLDLHPLKQRLPSFVMMMVTAPSCLLVSLASVTPVTPPKPPDPPDTYIVVLHRFFNTFSSLSLASTRISDLEFPSPTLESRGCDVSILLSGVSSSVYGCLFSRPSPQAFMVVVSGYLLGCVDWSSISSCFNLPNTPPCKVLHAHLSSLFFTYSATVEWFRQLYVWVMLELRFMFLADDILMGLVSFGSTFATSSSIYIALARLSAVCSSLTGFSPDVGVGFVYFFSWWQVEEKLIVIFIPMNMDVAGFSLVPRLNQSSLLIYSLIWSKLDEQVSLVLQGSSSHRILAPAYGAVCSPTGYTRCNL